MGRFVQRVHARGRSHRERPTRIEDRFERLIKIARQDVRILALDATTNPPLETFDEPIAVVNHEVNAEDTWHGLPAHERLYADAARPKVETIAPAKARLENVSLARLARGSPRVHGLEAHA